MAFQPFEMKHNVPFPMQ